MLIFSRYDMFLCKIFSSGSTLVPLKMDYRKIYVFFYWSGTGEHLVGAYLLLEK